MADTYYNVLVIFELYEEPEWTYVERIGAAAMDPLPLETAEDLYEEEEDFAHLIIPGHLFIPTIPMSRLPTSSISATLTPSGNGVLGVLAGLFCRTPINRGLRICDDCADSDASPVPRTCRSAACGAMNIFGCLTTQLDEGLGLRYGRNVVQDMQT
ncbi:hypothetical protein K469DRAFT_693612 [Zopfia rhizophila CBS 207.26]|uniref:Uncharacterized protein n=1 Tax=Zopfia rhizophila CBS 207.26 TaxID=1314779 RepID=A0A6A6DK75_9PEZI|nr:hypothetical protein K469DRAFT_693612 [Zopfia rhizophila CBS 207.26]